MTDLEISSKIYEIRGKQVMLDSDLAKLYNCKNGTKTINQAVNRHLDRFPNDFYFKLNEEEDYNILRSQTGTLELKQGKYSKYLPYAFTEQGVAMLATILRTDVASQVSINIMRAFVLMRHFIGTNLLEQKSINNMLLKHDSEIKLLEECFDKFEEKELFLNKIYDAYSIILDIFKSTKKELIIIDRYTDKSLLDIIKELKCNVILITSNKTKLTKLDIKKYNESYNNLKIIYDDTYHDNLEFVHLGAQLPWKHNVSLIEKVKDIILNDVKSIVK